MLTTNHHFPYFSSGMLVIAACALCLRVAAAAPGDTFDPIARIARIFNPQLVEVEDRIALLDTQTAHCSLNYEHSLQVGLGYRGCRANPNDPDPSITLDLGGEMPIQTIFLIPAQGCFFKDPGIFPVRFTLEISQHADFSQRTLVFTSGSTPFVQPDVIPVPFAARKESARYVRLTVQEGHRLESMNVYALSELVVISNGEPVSFNATVSTVGDFNTPGIWYPAALTDGRTPLGIWHNGSKPNIEPDDALTLTKPDETTTWTIQLDTPAPLDRIVLFPYQLINSFDVSVLPESLTVMLAPKDGQPGEKVFEWSAPLPGASQVTPLVIPLRGRLAQTLILTATRPSVVGDHMIHALSEIQIWSRGNNLAQGRPVQRDHNHQSATLANLTDGYSSARKIIPVAEWLHELHQRALNERELAPLRSTQQQLATNSELNTTWGTAMIMGLMFMIPVFIFERRRMITKDQLDQIRKRISADLHDDVGSNLGSISLIARTARKDLVRLDGPGAIAEDLADMEAIARESSIAMRDIVWLLERQQDSIGDLVQRMRETAGRMLREIDFTLDCQSRKISTRISLDAKRHLFLFFKESIHNILKHSHATRVAIRLWDEHNKLALEISDNGIGIPLSAEARPTAISKLEERARVLNGQMQISSSKETGTIIRLLVTRASLTTHLTRNAH